MDWRGNWDAPSLGEDLQRRLEQNKRTYQESDGVSVECDTAIETTVGPQFLRQPESHSDRTVSSVSSSQIRTTLKKKAFEEAGVPIRQQQILPQSTQQSTIVQQQQLAKQQTASVNQSLMGKSAEVTLNMLNAPETEVDVEGLPEECQVKLEFEGATEEVTS